MTSFVVRIWRQLVLNTRVTMKQSILFIFLTLNAVFGFEAGMRVKYGKVGAERANVKYFFEIPRTISDAVAEGYLETERPEGFHPNLKMYCHSGRELCPLFHPTSEFVAGVQIGYPADQFTAEPTALKKYFKYWSPPQDGDEPARNFYTLSQYYIPPTTEGSDEAIPTAENGETYQFGGVWVEGPDGELEKLSVNETELAQGYVKQTCVPRMGTHYYRNFTKDWSCEEFFPWFMVVKDQQLVGVGAMVFGTLDRSIGSTATPNMFEDPIEYKYLSLLQTLWPDAPSCLDESLKAYNLTQIHIYPIDDPWTVNCSLSDSIVELPETIVAKLSATE